MTARPAEHGPAAMPGEALSHEQLLAALQYEQARCRMKDEEIAELRATLRIKTDALEIALVERRLAYIVNGAPMPTQIGEAHMTDEPQDDIELPPPPKTAVLVWVAFGAAIFLVWLAERVWG